jgi:hypothetical protein
MLYYFEIFLHVIQKSTNRTINVNNVQNLGSKLMIHMKEKFPWCRISPSVHQICGHAWKLIRLNGGKSLSKWSEAPIEAWNNWHKHIRQFKSGSGARARQCSLEDNLQDVFTRMVDMTYPAISKYFDDIFCDMCDEVGHTVRSCHLYHDHNNVQNVDEFYT